MDYNRSYEGLDMLRASAKYLMDPMVCSCKPSYIKYYESCSIPSLCSEIKFYENELDNLINNVKSYQEFEKYIECYKTNIFIFNTLVAKKVLLETNTIKSISPKK
jgi:hypothetical protein